jgi:hypothetical protein
MKIDNAEKIARLNEKRFREVFGVKRDVFKIMLEVLTEKYGEEHKQGGRPSKLTVLDKLVIMLDYYKSYRAMNIIAFDYGVSKTRLVLR